MDASVLISIFLGVLCEPCHLETEVPLKWGHGQKYKKTNNDWLCVEGLEIKQ